MARRFLEASGIFFVFWEAAGSSLRGEFIEGAAVFAADEGFALHGIEDFVAAGFLKDLREGFELGGAFGPLPFGAAEAFLELFGEALEFEVVFGEVVDEAVLFGLEFHIVEFGVDHGGDVAGERPGSRRPDEEVFVGFLSGVIKEWKADEEGAVGGEFASVGDFHLAVGTAAATGPGHDVVAAIDLAAFEALLEEGPDGFVVFGGEGEVAAAPIGVAEA